MATFTNYVVVSFRYLVGMPSTGGPGEGPVVWEAGQPGTEPPASKAELVKYGELVILGYNGGLPQGDKGRRRSKFVLYRYRDL